MALELSRELKKRKIVELVSHEIVRNTKLKSSQNIMRIV